MPKLSIVIPAWNVERFIVELFDSIRLQEGVGLDDYEVIAVDDGSPDATLDVMRRYAEEHPEMRLTVLHQYNQGPATARNYGLSVARGSYVWFVDADDCIAPDALRNIIRVIDQYDVDGIKMGRCIENVLQADGSRIGDYHFKMCGDAGSIIKAYKLLSFNGDFGHTSLIWRRSILEENVIRYPENIFNNEDYLFTVRVACCADNVYIKNTMRYYLIRNHEFSITRGPVTFARTDRNIQGSLFVLGEVLKIVKQTNGWSDDKRQCLEERKRVLMAGSIARVLSCRQPLSVASYYYRRLQQLGCFPIDKAILNSFPWMAIGRWRWSFLLATQVCRLQPLLNMIITIYRKVKNIDRGG